MGSLTLDTQGVREQDWAENWKKYYKPFRAGERLVIKPSWEAHEPKDGDLVLGCRLEKDYAKNDVVVYERSGTLRGGRVLARGGDIVTLSESGVVEVNGSAQGGGILYPTYPKSLLSYPYAVPEDSVFILGDCRTQAEDSRDFGPVQCSAVKAKVITLIRRRGL